MDTRKHGKKILAVLCTLLIAVLQIVFVVPAAVHAKAGEQLEVRVQYEAEPGGKIRTIRTFSNAELEQMGAGEIMFSNITRVGTVMRSAALGVKLENVIESAGIELNSVKSFTFRTTDGYTMTFHAGDYLQSTGWYYPWLSEYSEKVDAGNGNGVLQMEEGALDDAMECPNSILALESFSTKSPVDEVTFGKMSKGKSYRFFTGQTDLSKYRHSRTEDGETIVEYDLTTSDDITSWESIKYIYGVDVVLKGAPPLKGISLSMVDGDIKVGSQQQIQVNFAGDDLGLFNLSDVTWTSSDESIATVDANGVVTIKEKGKVTITATAAGKSASITLGVPADQTDTQEEAGAEQDNDSESNSSKTKNKELKQLTVGENKGTQPTSKPVPKEDAKAKRTVVVREISIGEEILPEEEKPDNTAVVQANDSQAMEAVQPYDKKTVAGSAAAALLACGGGAIFRIRRFHSEMGIDTGRKYSSK